MITEATRQRLEELEAELTRRGIRLGVTWNPMAVGEEHQERRALDLITFVQAMLDGKGTQVYFYTDPTGREHMLTGEQLVERLRKAEQQLAATKVSDNCPKCKKSDVDTGP